MIFGPWGSSTKMEVSFVSVMIRRVVLGWRDFVRWEWLWRTSRTDSWLLRGRGRGVFEGLLAGDYHCWWC